MTDYKSMYYHLAGRMSITVDILEMSTETMEANINGLKTLAEKIKEAQLKTEEIFMNGDDDEDEINK